MAEPYLKYRTRFTSSLKNELIPLFNQLAVQTRIPKSRLLDEAIEDLLKSTTLKFQKMRIVRHRNRFFTNFNFRQQVVAL